LELLKTVIKTLSKVGFVPEFYLPHSLKGYKKKANETVMECHRFCLPIERGCAELIFLLSLHQY
jgi:hypothetical protein